MLRLGRLPEAWIAPPAVRELRELVRYRAKLVQLRSGLKAQVHAVMAKEGVLPAVGDMFGPAAGNASSTRWRSGRRATPIRVESLRDLIEVYDREIVMLERRIHRRAASPRGLSGGPGHPRGRTDDRRDLRGRDRRRDPVPHRPHLCSWAGLTPRHRESDTTATTAGITKQGSRLVRWARSRRSPATTAAHYLAAEFHRIAERRGTNKARVAIARKVLTLVYYGLRDGEIRCLAQPEAA